MIALSQPNPRDIMRPEVLFPLFAPTSRLPGIGPRLEKLLEKPVGAHVIDLYGNFSLLKVGIVLADKITTGSPKYREEILTAEFGYGMEGALDSRRDELIGIINGMDESS